MWFSQEIPRVHAYDCGSSWRASSMEISFSSMAVTGVEVLMIMEPCWMGWREMVISSAGCSIGAEMKRLRSN